MNAVKLKLLPSPIGFLLIPQFTSIAFSSAVESLRIANRYVAEKYRWRLLSLNGQPVPDSNGIPVAVQGAFDQTQGLGSLLVIADLHPQRYVKPSLIKCLRELATHGVTLGGIDTAPHILAAAGLLKERRATLHWENAPAFGELYPEIRLTSNLFEFDRGRVTCAGGTAAIDMMLYVIEAEHGHAVAVRVSEHFMHDRIRKGSETQRRNIIERFGVHHPTVVQAIRVMEQEIEEPLRASEVAEIIGVSPRQLLRLFKEHLDSSPTKLYLDLRLDRAQQLISQSEMSVIDIAIACGFQSQAHFARVYRKRFGCPPRGGRQLAPGRYPLNMDGSSALPEALGGSNSAADSASRP